MKKIEILMFGDFIKGLLTLFDLEKPSLELVLMPAILVDFQNPIIKALLKEDKNENLFYPPPQGEWA